MRQLTTQILQELDADTIRPALFVELVFRTETVYLWSGIGNITPQDSGNSDSTFPYGATFIGMGWLGQIPSMPQIADVVAQNITMTLNGIPTELLTDAINAVRQDSTGKVWFAPIDSNGVVIPDPSQTFEGHLDVPTIVEGAETSSISITAENPLVDLERSPNRRFTDIDQQVQYSGDLGFSAVTSLQGLYLGWPLYLTVPGGGIGPGSG